MSKGKDGKEGRKARPRVAKTVGGVRQCREMDKQGKREDQKPVSPYQGKKKTQGRNTPTTSVRLKVGIKVASPLNSGKKSVTFVGLKTRWGGKKVTCRYKHEKAGDISGEKKNSYGKKREEILIVVHTGQELGGKHSSTSRKSLCSSEKEGGKKKL